MIAIKSKPMKIINFISGTDLGGPKQIFVLYSEIMANLGHDVHPVIRQGAKFKPMLESLKLPIHEVSYSRITQQFAKTIVIKKLQAVIESIQPDVIITHKSSDLEILRKAAGENIRIIGFVYWISNKHIEHADELVAISTVIKQFLLDNKYTKPIHLIPGMVRIDSPPRYRDLPATPLIGAMGVLRRKKGFHTLIEALAILKKTGTPFKAIIAGKGQMRPYLLHLRRKHGLMEELIIRGWVSNDEREKFIDSIDLYILPSRIETFGLVVIEAMARMKRVIATKCGGPNEIIHHGKDGFLVEKQNPKAMADQIKQLIDKPSLSSTIPNSAMETVNANYTKEALRNKFKELLK